MTTTDLQRLTLLLVLLITGGILLLDVVLWWAVGPDATISRAWQALARRWPITMALLLVWIGILIGHLMPAGR